MRTEVTPTRRPASTSWQPGPCVRCVILLGLLLCTAGLAAVAGAQPGAKESAVSRKFDVPAGAAEKTLKQFSEQAGVQLLFSTDLVAGVRTAACAVS